MALRTSLRTFGLLALPALATSFAGPSPHDDVKGRALDYVTHQIRPIAASADGSRLYVLNQPGSRLAIFEHPGLARVADIPVGPGLVAVVERNPAEVWLVDSVQHSVTVVDPSTQTILRTIRVGAEPHDLVFTPDKSRAYVACSAVHRVDVIDAALKAVVKSIPVPAMNPRAMEWLDGRVWIASFRSGNNTAPMGRDAASGVNDIVRVRDLADFPTLQQLPDRDLFSITPQPSATDDDLDPTVHTRIGTILLDLATRPGTSELWIANTEALNGELRGERAFVEGQVVSNRITVLDVSSGAKSFIDLDALAPAGSECAQPAAIAFTADGSRAFVAGYNSDRVAVLDLGAGGAVGWAGHIDVLPGQSYPEGAGPRGLLVSDDGARLYVFSKIDNGLVAVPLGALPTSPAFAYTAPLPVDIGYTPVSNRELRGRFLFVNAKFSKSGTSSCASCHVDATTDGLAWDLSRFLDPEPTPPEALQFGIDVKGPLVTQQTLRLGETAPYHWRGEKARLLDFNVAFRDLLEHEVNGQPATIGGNFQYIATYMRDLPIPANPRQQLDRGQTAQQASGEDLFRTAPSFRGMACIDCHALPLGTSGEFVSFKVGGSSKTGVVPPLRGVADKLSPAYAIGGEFGTRTELGAGLLHGGAVAGLLQMLQLEDPDHPGQPLFQLTPAEAADIVAFLEAFDTGLAPSTTMQVTAHAGNWDTDARDALLLLADQALQGHCDLIARRSPLPGPPVVHRSLLYDPTLAAFRPAAAAGAPVTGDELLLEASNGSPVTFLGVPRLSGLQMALDRDLDGLYDLDELALGTSPENFDGDEDGYPDGYELEWGMDPFQPDSSSPDQVAPSLVGLPRLVYASGTAIKIEFVTDEQVRVVVKVDGIPFTRLPHDRGFDREFSVVIGELQPGRDYAVEIELQDPAFNLSTRSFAYSTRPRVFAEGVRVTGIRPTLGPSTGGSPARLAVALHLAQGALPALPGYEATVSVYHRRNSDGALTMITPAMPAELHSETGRVLLATALPSQASLGGSGKLIIAIQDIEPPPGAPPYVEALNALSSLEIAY